MYSLGSCMASPAGDDDREGNGCSSVLSGVAIIDHRRKHIHPEAARGLGQACRRRDPTGKATLVCTQVPNHRNWIRSRSAEHRPVKPGQTPDSHQEKECTTPELALLLPTSGRAPTVLCRARSGARTRRENASRAGAVIHG